MITDIFKLHASKALHILTFYIILSSWIAPLMYINGQEVDTTDLIDNDVDTCIALLGSDGCSMDKVKQIVQKLVRVIYPSNLKYTYK